MKDDLLFSLDLTGMFGVFLLCAQAVRKTLKLAWVSRRVEGCVPWTRPRMHRKQPFCSNSPNVPDLLFFWQDRVPSMANITTFQILGLVIFCCLI